MNIQTKPDVGAKRFLTDRDPIGRIRPHGGIVVILMVLCVVTSLTGCTKDLVIKNKAVYEVNPMGGPVIDIALAPFDPSAPCTAAGTPNLKPEDRIDVQKPAPEEIADRIAYYNAVVAALKRHPRVRHLRTDWKLGAKESGFTPDHRVEIRIGPDYSGDSRNWLVTWPGCYVFACAWNGFLYHADVGTDVQLLGLDSDASEAGLENIPAKFDISHCSYWRGFWSGTGWWFPGFGLHNTVTGLFFTKLDPNIVGEFHKEGNQLYGNYVADKIVRRLSAATSITQKSE